MTGVEGLCDLACEEITGDRRGSFCFVFTKRISCRNDHIFEVGENERLSNKIKFLQ